MIKWLQTRKNSSMMSIKKISLTSWILNKITKKEFLKYSSEGRDTWWMYFKAHMKEKREKEEMNRQANQMMEEVNQRIEEFSRKEKEINKQKEEADKKKEEADKIIEEYTK